MMKNSALHALLFSTMIAVASVAAAGDAVTQEVDRAKVCMMQDEVQARVSMPHAYQGKTYYLCCPMCVRTFESDPKRYSKAHDPVSGQPVDKATAPLLGYRGQAYFFDSEASRAAFAQDPERHVRSGPQ